MILTTECRFDIKEENGSGGSMGGGMPGNDVKSIR
jgi:hypothetical protein